MKLRFLLAGLALAILPTLPAAAHTQLFQATLTGPNEAPPNMSPGLGFGLVTLDFDLVSMQVLTIFADLGSPVTLAHIHCCTAVPGTATAGVATQTPTFDMFPSGVTSGSYGKVFDMTLASSYNPAFITANGGTVSGAFNALVAGMFDGKAYLNIHTTAFPGGEIRGFLQAVPEPSTYAMVLAGLALMGFMVHRRRTAA